MFYIINEIKMIETDEKINPKGLKVDIWENIRFVRT